MGAKLIKALQYLKSHPILTLDEAHRLGISRVELKRWVDAGKLFRVGRGAYSIQEPTDNAEQIISTLRPPCAIAGITALIHYNYTNVIGHKTWILVPKGHSVISRPDVETMRQNPEVFKLGLVTMKTEWGPVQIIDREKALLDAYRGHFLDIEEKYRVMKRYIRDPKHNYNNLHKYANKMRVNKKFHDLFAYEVAQQ